MSTGDLTATAAQPMGSVSATNVFSSKSDVAYAELRARILTGALVPGSRLDQYELAESMGMSITPLREAIRRLSSERLIELGSHRNARIASMNAAEARELFEVRLLLDPGAAVLAAERRTAEDITALRGAAARLLPVTRAWGEEALGAHRAFHRALYLASHNDVLIRQLDDLWDKSDRYRRLGLELPPGDEPRTRDHREHHELLELIVVGDAAGAGDLMRVHIQRSLTAAAITALEEREHDNETDLTTSDAG
ncbi:GntR family transcriptional regulator [Humibacillus xanthopallidus]|uniref:DNA-binding GntR family transcriptional regulator n=1 Tax=Humibacillus xanthopallidus TaxID=412689 RepID=A0A543HZI3_9MICO|nr:GntR family transcriptional regulator [Humibacillus xanthopallidus]TQM63753.1 DNA-binding GntR family transcriptional regulator [Humibacillus xanthopallidus]